MKGIVCSIICSFLFAAVSFAQQQQQQPPCQQRDGLGNIIVNPDCKAEQTQQTQPTRPVQAVPPVQAMSDYAVPAIQGILGYEYASARLSASAAQGASTPNRSFNGGFLEPTFHISEHAAIVGILDGTYRSISDFGPPNINTWAFSYGAGPQIYLLGHRYSWQPFARFTLGGATAYGSAGDWSDHATSFAWQFGAGMDYKAGRIGYRLIGLNYIRATKSFNNAFTGSTNVTYSSIKLGFGVTF